MKLRLLLGTAVLAGALALVACGDDAANGDEASGGDGGSVPVSGVVAPDTFMTFEGRSYRLVEVLQANLLDSDEFEAAGAATEIDIDAADMTVYERDGDAEHLYTFSQASGAGESAVPAVWLRWKIEP